MYRNIIIEGVDGSGKTTLARRLSNLMYIPVMLGAGPERYPDEMQDRITAYDVVASKTPIIFDRHPCISDYIYNEKNWQAPPNLMSMFMIYCTAPADPNYSHEVTDTQAMRAKVDNQYSVLCKRYEDLFRVNRNAHYYTLGDSIEPVLKAYKMHIELGKRMNP